MDFPHYLRIERKEGEGSRHYVVHVVDPRFTMELEPDTDAPDKVGRGVIRRVCLPNSWAGDYGACARALAGAQEFFSCSFARPKLKPVFRRH